MQSRGVLATYEECISRPLLRMLKVVKTTNQDKPIASIDDANAHMEAFAASEIQYAT